LPRGAASEADAPLRIVYLINGFHGGGAALPVPDVAAAMTELGHEVEVVALMRQDGRAEKPIKAAGIRYRILGPERVSLRSFIRLMRHLRRERPDLLWTSLARSTLLGQLAGALLKIPVVSWQHNAWLKPGNVFFMRRTKPLTRLWIADSDAVRSWAIAKLGLPADRFLVWPLFVANPSAPVARGWQPGEPFRIGSLGRLHPNKRYDLLIRAMARLQQLDPTTAQRVQVTIAGSGEELLNLQALIADLGVVNVALQGYVEQPQQFLAGLHGYVQPSRNEGLCLAAHEALQAGLPVIATPVGQMACSIRDGVNGWQIPVDDIDALTQALQQMIGDPQRSAALGAAAREGVMEIYSRARFRAICAEILRRVTAG
jgi:glycosyltransferase involved in cell wall biosynthesis